jgi:energy-coupling factor transport system ATP-binding protein
LVLGPFFSPEKGLLLPFTVLGNGEKRPPCRSGSSGHLPMKNDGGMIEVREVGFSYPAPEGFSTRIFEGLNLSVPQARYVALMGPNGSGKSTLGKLIKGLLSPSWGQIFIQGEPLKRGEVSSRVGYVFSNPENQIISSEVEEDVAFGLANMGMDPFRMSLRVEESLRLVGMEAYRYHSPHFLSGGQQQKVVMAGILAMECEVLVLDEPTSMLDLHDRKEILDLFREIHERGSRTLLHITHSFEEALQAQDLICLDHGRVEFHGSLEEFLTVEERPQIELPPLLRLIQGLRARGHNIAPEIHSYEELRNLLLGMSGGPAPLQPGPGFNPEP